MQKCEICIYFFHERPRRSSHLCVDLLRCWFGFLRHSNILDGSCDGLNRISGGLGSLDLGGLLE